MRTRFLATDYFSPASAASCSDQALALASLRFPPLPVPSLPPDPRFPFPLPFPAAADLPAVSITGDGLDSLPISSALSEFLAAVIPQPLPVPTTPAADEGLDDFLYDRGEYSKGFSWRESVALKIPNKGLDEISREKEGEGDGSRSMSDRSGTSTDTKRWELLKEHIFEVAEVDLPQVFEGHVASFGGDQSGDGVTLSFHVPDVKIHLDFIDIDTEMTLRYPIELAESIYQVEKILVKHNDEEDLLSARNSNFSAIAALDCGVARPQLEVSRHSWELNECPTKAEVSNIFHNLVEHLGEAQVQHPCNREICSTYAHMVEEVKSCQLNSELQVSCQQRSALGFDFLEYFWRSAKHQDEDKQNNIYVPIPLPHDPPAVVETVQKYRQESDAGGNGYMEKSTSEKATSLFESMSQSSELNFYLNVRSGTKSGANKENVSTLDIPTLEEQVGPFSSRPKVDKLFEIHRVDLSNSIQDLIKDIHIIYKSVLHESAYLKHAFSGRHGLCIWKQILVGLMTGDGSDVNEKMELMILCGLKQVACYLCFFGLHAAHEYINSLIREIRYFASSTGRLINIQFFIREARLEAKKQQLDSHPSLSAIEKILRSHMPISQKRRKKKEKILIVADRAFLLPLGQKLNSLKMTVVELGKDPAAPYLGPLDPVNRTNPTRRGPGGLPKLDCILLDNKNIPASFPFSEFGIILEYGGPNKSSTLLSLASKLEGFPPLHFLCVKVDVEDPSAALVEDYRTDQELKATLDTVLHALKKDLQEKMSKMHIVDSLNFVPATTQLQERQENLCKHLTADSTKKLHADDQLLKLENLEKKNTVDAHNFVPAAEQRHIEEILSERTVLHPQHFVHALEKSSSTYSVSANVIKAPQDNLSATDLPSIVKVGSITPGRLSNLVIVVNTVSHGKNMIFSRRSSYQQILSLEKGGIQVVERDVDLPVDLILGASVCLVWFETKIFGSNDFTASTETSSITNIVETIATNILMPISFCFSGCIMVFEGEPHSLSAVMESSDSLYAAAASLVMNLQLFFSHTPKSTDEIILRCIRNVNRLNKAPSPDIPESESLAESFLTKFPSINPLSAYIILSCGGSLVEFLGWSHERRIQAVGKYLLSPQSISLFNALCKFGELGESKGLFGL